MPQWDLAPVPASQHTGNDIRHLLPQLHLTATCHYFPPVYLDKVSLLSRRCCVSGGPTSEVLHSILAQGAGMRSARGETWLADNPLSRPVSFELYSNPSLRALATGSLSWRADISSIGSSSRQPAVAQHDQGQPPRPELCPWALETRKMASRLQSAGGKESHIIHASPIGSQVPGAATYHGQVSFEIEWLGYTFGMGLRSRAHSDAPEDGGMLGTLR